MIRILLPLAGGILCGTVWAWRPGWVLLVGLLIFLLYTSTRKYSLDSAYRSVFGGLLAVWLFLFGWTYVQYQDPLRDPAHWQYVVEVPGKDTHWAGRITKVKESERWTRLSVKVHAWGHDDDDPIHPVRGRMMVYVPRQEEVALVPGMWFRFAGEPQAMPPPQDPEGFDWRQYMRIRGIGHQLFLRDADWEAWPDGSFSLMGSSHTIRGQFYGILTSYVPDSLAMQLAGAMVLGARDELSDAMNEAYQASGAVHILAVSGLHVGLVAGMVLGLMGYVVRQKRLYWIRALVAVGLVWGYILVTGMADSAVRAGVLFSFIIVGRSASRHAEALNLLAAAVVVLLLVNPWMIHHVGFQLSVLAVAGILFFHPILYRAWYPPGKVSLFFWNLFCVTLAAQLATVMLSLFYFHRFPVYFVLSGLFVVPMAGAFLGTGVATLLLHGVSPLLAGWCGQVLNLLAGVMNGLVFGIAQLPGASLTDLYPRAWWIVLLPLGAGLIMAAFAQRRTRLLLTGVGALVLGLVIEAGQRIQSRVFEKPQWSVIGRQDRPPELLFEQGDNKLALVFTDEGAAPTRQNWPGYGEVWETPLHVDFDFGILQKRGASIRFGVDTISLDPLTPGSILVATEAPGRNFRAGYHAVILPPNMDWKSRNAWSRAVPDSLLHDMRVAGCWQRKLDLEGDGRN